MGTNEDYLDSLLKGVVKDKVSQQATSEQEGHAKDHSSVEEENMLPFDIDAMLSELTGAGMDLGLPTTQEEEEEYGAVTVEDTQEMSEDEIENRITTSRQMEEDAEDIEAVDTDSFAVESDINVQEISSLLKKSEENEAVTEDVLGFLKKIEEDKTTDEAPVDLFSEFADSFGLEDKINEKSKDEIKALKRNQKGEKKPGVLSRLFHVLTVEAEPSEEEKALILTKENSKIIQELDAEKGKKKKKVKAKKGNKKGNKGETGEEESEAKKPQKIKKKREKFVKPTKPKMIKEPAPVVKSKKISKKSIVIIFVFSFSLLLAIFLLGTLFSDLAERRIAQSAFDQKEYQAAYEYFFEAEEGTAEADKFHHARAVMRIKRRLESYEQKIMVDKKVEALHSLMQAIYNYDELYQYALNYNASNEVAEIYAQILGILYEEYDLTEETAKTIATCDSDKEYTGYLVALAEGKSIESVGQKDLSELGGNDTMQDILPEEMELGDREFTN